MAWEGEHVTLRTDSTLDGVCGGTLAQLDALVLHVGSELGVEIPYVDYNWVPAGVEDHCSVEHGGCASGTAVFSEYLPHQHEIVHAVRGTENSAYDAFEEGLAEYLGDDWDRVEEFGGSVTAMWELEGSDLPAPYYPLAGHFVSYLAEEFGEHELGAFDRISAYTDSWAQTEVSFEDVFMMTFSDVVAARMADYSPCEQTHYRSNTFECSQPATVADQALTLEVNMSCTQPSVVGPRRGERWTTVAIDVPLSRYYDVGLQKIGGSHNGRMRYRRCGQSCYDLNAWQPFDTEVESAPEAAQGQSVLYSTCLPEGRYVFRFAVDDGDEGDFVFTLSPSTISPECSPL